MSPKIVLPTVRQRNPRKRKHTRRQRTPVRLTAMVDESLQFPRPTLVFNRHFPRLTFAVPPVRVPLYWFDQKMVDKRLLLPIPPNTFVVDGRRFKVLCQDYNEIGRFGYTRWLVYEEAALPKGVKP